MCAAIKSHPFYSLMLSRIGYLSPARSMKAPVTPLLCIQCLQTNSCGSPLKAFSILNTLWLQRIWRKFPLGALTGCPGFKESNRLPRSPSPPPHATLRAAGKNDEGVLCTSSLPHTLLHQALLGLVGLRMEHDDRQKQSSAPPRSAVFYTARAWKGNYEPDNRRSDRLTPGVNKISVGEHGEESLHCSCEIMSALKLRRERGKKLGHGWILT